MQLSNPPYLGLLIPSPKQEHALTNQEIQAIQDAVNAHGGMQGRKVEVLVTSGNQMKIDAAKNAVAEWIQQLFHETLINPHVQGFAVSSNIDEQPHSQDDTLTGAQNRLKNLKKELALNALNSHVLDGTLRVLISLENGIMLEKINPPKNSALFTTHTGAVWVDRCITTAEIWFNGRTWEFSAISEGVTTPKTEVEASEQTSWTQTAGAFIAKKYGWKSNNFHGDLAGKGRQEIMEDLLKAAFGLPYTA